MLSCRDVSRTIAADEPEESTFGRRFQVRLHLLMCRHCRRYAAQIRAIGQAAREIYQAAPDEATVDRLHSAILRGGKETDPGASPP